ncbi:AAA family ATPase [Neobacillus notoginsengisoli]|uniref:AAA family ATPase n=1 Tax=Neobacillus notoginsengisoli TaxID=1578198 RepID=A0A417YY85_9BACI|nr:AAA family ATPase [Neobacillus notoginsengisoli]RHW42691.1 AAA family ATPase [Neobacillus notoginsengisoli]
MSFKKWVRILVPEIQLFDFIQERGFWKKKRGAVQPVAMRQGAGVVPGQSSSAMPIGGMQSGPVSTGAVREVLSDAKYGMKQLGLNKSNEELDRIFNEIRETMNMYILRQEEFIEELLISYKKAFFQRAKGAVQNTILLAGPAGTGKYSSLAIFIDQLYKKKLVPYSKYSLIDLSRYEQGEVHTNFIADVSAAFNQGIGTVCFSGFEKANTEIISYVARLFNDGFFRTPGNVMVDASDFFLLLYLDADMKPEERGQLPPSIAKKIPAGLLKGIQSYALTAPLGLDDLEEILRQKLGLMVKKFDRQAQVAAIFHHSFYKGLSKQIYETNKYGEEVERLIQKDIYPSLLDLRAREKITAGDRITVKMENNMLIAVKGEKQFPLKAIELVKEENLDDLLQELHSLTGLQTVKRSVEELLQTVRMEKARQQAGLRSSGKMAVHMIFTGNPGTGKTTVARLIARILKAMGILSQGQLVEVTRQDLVGQYLGSTAPKTNSVIESALGGVLFIDEAYTLARSKNDPFGLEAIDTIVKGMEDHRDNLVAVIAGYTREMETFLTSNPGLKSRFPFIIEFPDYTPADMLEILKGMASARGFHFEPSLTEGLLELFERKQIPGRNDSGNGRLVRNLLEEAIRRQSVRLSEELVPDDLTLLTAEDFGLSERKPFDIETAFANIVGLEPVKHFVRSLEKQLLANQKRKEAGIITDHSQTLNIIFSGNPGTGKTTMARLLAELLKTMGVLKKGHLVEVDRSDLVAEYVGQTAVKTTEAVQRALGGVLFIDEAYSLVEEGIEGGGFGKEAIDTLVGLIENHRSELVVILAGYTQEMEQFVKSNPGLSSRFPLKIEFPDYTPEQLVQITDLQVKGKGFVLEKAVHAPLADYYETKQIPGKNDSGNGRLVRNTVEAAIRTQAVRIVETEELPIEELNVLKVEDFSFPAAKKVRNALDELDSVIGLEQVKTFVRSLSAQIEVAERRKRMGLPDMGSQSLHMIFKGNPGTGKTMMARILAKRLKELGVIKLDEIVETDRSGLVAGYVGQTAIKTRQVLEKALGGILFIDEAYALAGEGNDFGQEAIDTIVKFMDDHRENIIVILAGYDEDMDILLDMNAGLRSRFPNIITFEDYSTPELLEISKAILKPKGYELSRGGEEALIKLLREQEGNTHSGNGRFARNVCEAAIRCHALRMSGQENPTREDLTLLQYGDFIEGAGVEK